MTVWAFVLQVPLRGHPAFDHKLKAAGHIYNLWTARGTEPGALASRFASTSLVIFQAFALVLRNVYEPFAYIHLLLSAAGLCRYFDGSIDTLQLFMALPSHQSSEENPVAFQVPEALLHR